MKLHQDDSASAVAQSLRRIPFSRRQKVRAKLKQLEELEVIEKVMFPLMAVTTRNMMKTSTK